MVTIQYDDSDDNKDDDDNDQNDNDDDDNDGDLVNSGGRGGNRESSSKSSLTSRCLSEPSLRISDDDVECGCIKQKDKQLTKYEELRPEVHSPCKPPPPGLDQHQLSQLKLGLLCSQAGVQSHPGHQCHQYHVMSSMLIIITSS